MIGLKLWRESVILLIVLFYSVQIQAVYGGDGKELSALRPADDSNQMNRILESRYDMLAQSLDHEGPLGWSDFLCFSTDWLSEDENCPSNLNHDERVNLPDLSLPANVWSLQNVSLLRFGLITDTHNSDRSTIYASRYYMDVEKKVNLAMETFTASAVDAIFHLGDIADDYNDLTLGNPTCLQRIVEVMGDNTGEIPVYWVLGNRGITESCGWTDDEGGVSLFF